MAFGFSTWGFPLFTIGSLCWIVVAVMAKDRALLTLNATFFIANIIGLYRAFL